MRFVRIRGWKPGLRQWRNFYSLIDWEAFPKALIVSDKKIYCDKIDDRITEIEELIE